MCQHEPDYIDSYDQVQVCLHCKEIIAQECEKCSKEGMGEENELECDWINYGNDYVTCTRCNGFGWIYLNNYHPSSCQN